MITKQLTTLILLCISLHVSAKYAIDVNGGLSLVTPYTFIDTSDARIEKWFCFDNVVHGGYSTSFSVNLISEKFRVGLYSGYQNLYDMRMVYRYEHILSNTKIGSVVSMPLMPFIELTKENAYARFGVGPTINRFNYNAEAVATYDIPEFEVEPLFSFLFCAGYKKALTEKLAFKAGGELLVVSPMKLWEYLPESVQNEFSEALHAEYNRFDYVQLIGNLKLLIGIEYTLGETILFQQNKK